MGYKNINEIRKSITKRKQDKRQKLSQPAYSSRKPDIGLQEEEKHGYFPFSSNTKPTNKRDEDKLYIPAIIFKVLLAGILFFATALLIRVDAEGLQKPKQFVLNAMTKEFNFAKIQLWYRENLGAPFAFLNQNSNDVEPTANGLVLPVNGTISESFQETGEGVLIEVTASEDMNVTAMEAGTVLFAGNEKETGKTIKIQHEDESISIYGNLKEIDVFQYQFVSKNQVIGNIEPESGASTASLYFAIKDEKSYVDPVKVIHVDDQK